jgi:DNA processing protein
MSSDKLLYQIGLTMIPGIGSINAKKLISYIGSEEAVFKEKKSQLIEIPGIGEILADEIINQDILKNAEQEINFINKEKINTVFYLDKNFPERLKHCEDSPVLLYYKGETNFNSQKILSIIGTRNATNEGKEITEKLIEDLAVVGHKPIIVSGLAYGIDIYAHKAALKNNLQTFAVLGHGLDILYPAQHKSIAEKIITQGALITEFTSKSRIDKQNFVKRNRIVAGISDATIVIESAEKGGALITAEIANSYNRDVFAFPGRINDKYSEGCNKLIKINKAMLIENYKDLEYILGWNITEKKKNEVQTLLFYDFTDDEKKIIQVLKLENGLMIDTISSRTQLPMSKVSALLLNMEFAGILKCLPGKIFSLIGNVNC